MKTRPRFSGHRISQRVWRSLCRKFGLKALMSMTARG